MSKFIFKEATCGKNRTYTLTYYSWLCMELINAHRLYKNDFFQMPYSLPSEGKRLLSAAEDAFDKARNLAYEDYAPRNQEELFEKLARFRGILKEDFIDCYYKGRPSGALNFESYVEDMTARIERESKNATWLSNKVQDHFREFAVRPLTRYSMAAVSYNKSSGKAPAQESLFYSLAELRDRAFREPTTERVARYLQKVELIGKTPEYKRLRYLAQQLGDDYSEAIQELEDELTVSLLWDQVSEESKGYA